MDQMDEAKQSHEGSKTQRKTERRISQRAAEKSGFWPA